jgi:hypothetical protein
MGRSKGLMAIVCAVRGEEVNIPSWYAWGGGEDIQRSRRNLGCDQYRRPTEDRNTSETGIEARATR